MVITRILSTGEYEWNRHLESGLDFAVKPFVSLSRWLLESIFAINASGTFIHIYACVCRAIPVYIYGVDCVCCCVCTSLPDLSLMLFLLFFPPCLLDLLGHRPLCLRSIFGFPCLALPPSCACVLVHRSESITKPVIENLCPRPMRRHTLIQYEWR